MTGAQKGPDVATCHPRRQHACCERVTRTGRINRDSVGNGYLDDIGAV